VPYLKFSRDRRGYEYVSIVEPGAARRGKPSRPRVLFWFRTPPQVKVGRLPFTDEVQRAIEAQYPKLRFDWPRLLATPIPPPDAEHWRERRRAEKAARQAAREAEAGGAEAGDREGAEGETGDPDAAFQEVDDSGVAQDEYADVISRATTEGNHFGERPASGNPDEMLRSDEGDEGAETTTAPRASESAEIADVPAGPAESSNLPAGGRRRRRRGRRRRGQAAGSAPEQAPSNVPGPPTDEV
jgi:hypothetical protein